MKKIFTLFALFSAFFLSQAQTTVTVFEENYAQLGYENYPNFQKMTEAYPYRAYNSTRYNPFYNSYQNQNIINPNQVLITMNQTLYLGSYGNNEGLTIFTGVVGLADLMVGDVINLTVGPNYKITPVEGLSDAVASDNETLTLTKNDGTTKEYEVTPYTMTVTKSGTVYFRGANLGDTYTSCPIASLSITRTLNGQDTFIGSALNGNYGSGLPIAVLSTPTSTVCNFGFEDVMSLNLTATGDAYFQNPNLQPTISNNPIEITGYPGFIEINGTYYMPVYMAPGTYSVDNTNVKAATLWAYSNSATSITFTDATGTTTMDLKTVVGDYDITNCTEFTVGEGGMYGIFYLSNESDVTTVSVGKIGNMEWTPELATGSAATNPFADILSYIQTSANTGVNLGLTVTIEPVFTPETQPTAWSDELAMPEWIWNQMVAVETTSNKKIDGYYDAQTTPTISTFKTVGSSMQASIENYSFPCSGKYKLTITSTNENVVIEYEGEQEFEVYPSTNLVYQYTLNGKSFNEGINISGYTVEEGNMIIYNELSDEQLQNLTLYIPGVYVDAVNSEESTNSHIYYLLSNEESLSDDNDITLSDLGFTVLEEDHKISLAELSTSKKYLYVVLAKNQATTPLSEVTPIIISKGNNPTGIEEIDTEVQGEAVYYNLQGVKVANPEKGIFVKVQNGKATKVVM